ncbi:MAG: tetratricopeptide repeat protein, partial [Geminicoccaceae bacterium]
MAVSEGRAQWFTEITGSTTDRPDVSKCAYRNGLIELKPLDIDRLVGIARESADCAIEVSDAVVTRHLQRLDTMGRPLYACLIGQALGLGGIKPDATIKDVLDSVLVVDRDKRWTRQFGEVPQTLEEDTPPYRLAALATMIRGIVCSRVNEKLDWGDDAFAADTRKRALCLTDGPQETINFAVSDTIPGLEPDILGERFVIKLCDKVQSLREAVVEAAWQIDPEQMANFLQRIAQDFPYESCKLIGIEPSSDTAWDAFAKVSSPILVDLYNAGDAVKEIPDTVLDALVRASESSDPKLRGRSKRNLAFAHLFGEGVEQNTTRAMVYYREAAEAGDGLAMAYYGSILEQGRYIKRNMADAIGWYRKGVERKDGKAMAYLGRCYEFGNEVIGREIGEAIALYQQGVDLGDELCAQYLVDCLWRGKGLPENREAAIRLLESMAASGFASAYAILGEYRHESAETETDHARAHDCFVKGKVARNADCIALAGRNLIRGRGVERDAFAGDEWLREAIDLRSTLAMRILGFELICGADLPKNLDEGVRFIEQALARGDTSGAAELANSYLRGIGVETDPVEAHRWYRKAADAGDAVSMLNVGVTYYNGTGVEADREEANRWYRKAADAGDTTAMRFLGNNYEHGAGVEAGPEKANRWYRKAADAGDTTAMRFLGNNYARGTGAEADPKEANRWYRKAADVGDATAMRYLANNALAGKGFDGIDFAEAVRLARLAKEAGDAEAEKTLHPIDRNMPEETQVEVALAGLRDAAWPFNPLVPGDWQPLMGEKARDAVSTVLSFAAIREHRDLTLRALRRHAPDYYPGCDLIEALFEMGDEQRVACILMGADQSILLDGTSRAVHAFNQIGHVDLTTTERCMGYLRFFCMAICGEDGHFRIVDVLEPEWFATKLDESHVATLADMIVPAAVIDETADRCTMTATVKYSAALFQSTFAIARDGAQPGMAEMLEDQPLGADIPFLWEGFDGPFRRQLPRSASPVAVAKFAELSEAAEKGDVNAMRSLGLAFEHGNGVEADPREANRCYRKAADAGDATAMRFLGNNCSRGNGIEADLEEAHRWYRKAADAGDAKAMRFLGNNYSRGNGIEADLEEAHRWYRQAADAGDAVGMLNVGVTYEHGTGVETDPAEAHRWYRKAADAGDAVGMVNVGVTCEKGTGTEADPVEANRWYRKAADAGYATAMRFLGNNYARGTGIEADPVEASRWYR